MTQTGEETQKIVENIELLKKEGKQQAIKELKLKEEIKSYDLQIANLQQSIKSEKQRLEEEERKINEAVKSTLNKMEIEIENEIMENKCQELEIENEQLDKQNKQLENEIKALLGQQNDEYTGNDQLQQNKGE